MSGRTAIVAGASGLVGEHCLRRLLASGMHEHVVAFVRGPLNVTHKRLEQRTVDYERLGRMSAFPRVQDVFCCLGTTMKKAGSEAAFRKVDFEYVVRLAETSLRTGADHFYLVSAVGADPKSRVFYSRVKGEAEDSVAKLGFAGLPHLPAVVPRRPPAETRPGEAARDRGCAPLLDRPRRARPEIPADQGRHGRARDGRRRARSPGRHARLRRRRDGGLATTPATRYLSRSRMSVMRFFWSSGAIDSAFR